MRFTRHQDIVEMTRRELEDTEADALASLATSTIAQDRYPLSPRIHHSVPDVDFPFVFPIGVAPVAGASGKRVGSVRKNTRLQNGLDLSSRANSRGSHASSKLGMNCACSLLKAISDK